MIYKISLYYYLNYILFIEIKYSNKIVVRIILYI